MDDPHALTDREERTLEAIRRQLDVEFPSPMHSVVFAWDVDPVPVALTAKSGSSRPRRMTLVVGLLLAFAAGGGAGAVLTAFYSAGVSPRDVSNPAVERAVSKPQPVVTRPLPPLPTAENVAASKPRPTAALPRPSSSPPAAAPAPPTELVPAVLRFPGNAARTVHGDAAPAVPPLTGNVSDTVEAVPGNAAASVPSVAGNGVGTIPIVPGAAVTTGPVVTGKAGASTPPIAEPRGFTPESP